MPNFKIYVAEGDDLIYVGEAETNQNTQAVSAYLDEVETDQTTFEVIAESNIKTVDVEEEEPRPPRRVFKVSGEGPKRGRPKGSGRGPGRPKKSETTTEEKPKRGRGRPKGSTNKKRSPGRPKGSGTKKRGPGRPPGSKNKVRKSPFKGGGGDDE